MSEDYITGTLAASGEFIPEVWAKEVQLARESSLIMANLVRRLDSEVSQYGDIVHIPNISNLTAENISTSTGDIESQNVSETPTTLTINKWKGVIMHFLDIAKVQSKYDLMAMYTKKMGYALGLSVETDLLALAPSVTPNVGTFATAVTDAVLRGAVQKLDDARAPFADRHFVYKPSVKNTLLSIDKFVRYDAVAYPMGGSPVLKGNMGEIYGVACHVSPEVYITSSDVSNIMFHRDWAGLAIQKDIAVEKFARRAFTDRIGAQELYGVAELRADQAVQVKS